MLDYELPDESDGGPMSLTSFTGKNGFGLELQFDALCTFEGQQVSGVKIDESKKY